jgi:hypothetical protein
MKPRRSVLFMPGSNARAMEKARTLPADALILDLEDAVAPEAKASARAQVLAAVGAGGYGPREVIVRVNDRGPYHRNRVIDLSIGTAKALEFYSRGLARVRVEYVGPAPIQGSDDTMLMATLREGSSAPAPSTAAGRWR